jgi:hypothetical protein
MCPDCKDAISVRIPEYSLLGFIRSILCFTLDSELNSPVFCSRNHIYRLGILDAKNTRNHFLSVHLSGCLKEYDDCLRELGAQAGLTC